MQNYIKKTGCTTSLGQNGEGYASIHARSFDDTCAKGQYPIVRGWSNKDCTGIVNNATAPVGVLGGDCVNAVDRTGLAGVVVGIRSASVLCLKK